jgi:hypothetical protein
MQLDYGYGATGLLLLLSQAVLRRPLYPKSWLGRLQSARSFHNPLNAAQTKPFSVIPGGHLQPSMHCRM